MNAVETRPNEPQPELGPARRALSPRWQKAATALFITKDDRTAALRLAGYEQRSKSSGGIRVTAHRMFQDPRMRAAVRELAAAMIETSEPELLATTFEILRDTTQDAKDRLMAARMIWDRANPVMTKHKVEVEHYDTIQVRNVSGGISTLRFRTYSAGRVALQGQTLDCVWLDEEPDDASIYGECLTRVNSDGRHMRDYVHAAERFDRSRAEISQRAVT